MDERSAQGVRVPRPIRHWPKTDFGLRHLATIYGRLFVDDEWSVRSDREFTWWLHDLAQTVRIGEPAAPTGGEGEATPCAWLTAETLIAEGIDVAAALPVVTTLNSVATQSALIVDTERRELRSSLRVRLTKDADDLLVLVRTAIALQAAEATHLGRVLDWPVARRPHPTSGPRAEADELVNVPAALGANTTDGGIEPGLFGAIAQIGREDGLWVAATHDRKGLTAEIPWSGLTPAHEARSHLRTALFRMRTTERHPVIGRGVLVTLELPPLHDAADAAELANDLNVVERSDRHPVSAMGAWSARPATTGKMSLAWSSFIPAVELLRMDQPSYHLLCHGYDARNRTGLVHRVVESWAADES